jgi:hypothetical protein
LEGFKQLKGVLECDNGCGLKCFFARKCIKIIYIFYFFKIIFHINILK